ncbi:MAG: hypothetical protein QNJ72_19740 [Pleurocapsa sp. MO_226.B13]|nr:hypothetical protein [Pleurocapsa sp. MO_226.B13]
MKHIRNQGQTIMKERIEKRISLRVGKGSKMIAKARDYPLFSQKRRSLNSEALPDLGLTLVLTPAVKRPG